MICPNCKQDVTALSGNGEYPNSSYRCDECYDRQSGLVICGFLAFVVFGVLPMIAFAAYMNGN